MAAILGSLAVRPTPILGQAIGPAAIAAAGRVPIEEYDRFAKLCFNENSYGPPKSVLDAMAGALKFANRYMSPNGGILDAIASHHGVGIEHVLLGAGSSEILDIVGTTFLGEGKKVVGVEPTFSEVYQHATGLKADAIRLPLGANFRQNIPAMIKAVKDNHPNVGFVYLCNPNNPTGVIVTKDEVKQLLDGLPPEVPALIDEAYYHFVEDPAYATSVPWALEGRPVIVTRTFSKIAAMAGMRLGYAIAPESLIQRMAPYIDNMNVNVVAKWGGAAALADKAALETMRRNIIQTRKRTTAALEALGYAVIPSEANFFMVNIRREVRSVLREFRQEGVLAGRPFPPMDEYLRVSVGTDAEMDRFLAAFKVIMKA
ncbi:MAG TPA: histidinol-phosphate transaminase [Verrucomicrobiae bacterium]|jgi:histidinol-phosphate aminotransferase